MKLKSIITATVAAALMLSCSQFEDNYGVDNPVSWSRLYLSQAYNGELAVSLDIPADTTVRVFVNLGGVAANEKDIDVYVEYAPELVTTFNTSNGTAYRSLPQKCFSISSSTVTISAGENRSDPLEVSLSTENFAGIGPYLLPLTITGSSDPDITINSELKTLFISLYGKRDESDIEYFDRSTWTATASSWTETSSEKSYASYAIDSNNNTFWASQYTPERVQPPHTLTVDMGEQKEVNGVYIRGRVSTGDVLVKNGLPRYFDVATSIDGQNWEDAGSYSQPYQLENVTFLTYGATGRYIRLTVNNSYSGAEGEFYQTAIGEFKVF